LRHKKRHPPDARLKGPRRIDQPDTINPIR